MSADASGRALRTLVAQMAELGDGDLKSILAELEAPDRARLLDLIEAFRRGDLAAREPGRIGGLAVSAWLAARLQGGGAPGMTVHASQTLRRLAIENGWTDQASAAAPTPRPQGGVLARLGLRP
jgi:hypothetical protein